MNFSDSFTIEFTKIAKKKSPWTEASPLYASIPLGLGSLAFVSGMITKLIGESGKHPRGYRSPRWHMARKIGGRMERLGLGSMLGGAAIDIAQRAIKSHRRWKETKQ